MSIPMTGYQRDPILSEKANQLAHDAIGTWGRRSTNGLLFLSAVLGYGAGFSGLSDWIGKQGTAALGLAAGIATTIAVFMLITLKSADHLALAGEYEALYSRTAGLRQSSQKASMASTD